MFAQPFLSLVIFCLTKATVDLNLPELEYLANHLHSEECRKLVASLHFKSYEKPQALEVAEINVSKDIPCIRLLLHWNSQPGEGKGETHEILQHRLRQIGRSDLADWIGKTVFHQLGEEMMEDLKHPFDEVLNATETHEHVVTPTLFPTYNWDVTEWIAFDTICWGFVLGLSALALVILFKALYLLIKKKTKKRTIPPKTYATLESDASSESEDLSQTTYTFPSK
ncbi:hypothetical protein RN001_014276 [Aquatica leii]|uniref:Death domain-containing protein n=1 Tax=Aquatica leii TaxID=1421715 RepID=A0AAN7P423_9COLE|nr:hypothetical protein RN001_014276 [Aquatica leii]